MKTLSYSFFIGMVMLCYGCSSSKHFLNKKVNAEDYLSKIKKELQVQWPDNKTINLVYHGHSVPSGYFKTPAIKTLSSYPHLVLKNLKVLYPYAAINTIVTALGGENAVKGAERFKEDVLNHKPDVLFLDYGLNDRKVGLEKAKIAWEQMIEVALNNDIPIILLTPSPDYRVDYSNPQNELFQHTNQIRKLAKKYGIGVVDSYKLFEPFYHNMNTLKKYMAQVNHPNERGHELIANEIMKYFK
jgi:lysophospholipase L1-like esterase